MGVRACLETGISGVFLRWRRWFQFQYGVPRFGYWNRTVVDEILKHFTGDTYFMQDVSDNLESYRDNLNSCRAIIINGKPAGMKVMHWYAFVRRNQQWYKMCSANTNPVPERPEPVAGTGYFIAKQFLDDNKLPGHAQKKNSVFMVQRS